MYQQILEAPPNQIKAEAPKAVRFDVLPKDPKQLGLVFQFYEKFHTDINIAIHEFNAAQEPEAKKAALIKIQQAIDYIDLHSSPENLVYALPFHTLKQDLFSKIKKAFAENGVDTLLKAESADSPIARILSDMSLDKADQLMEILHSGVEDMSDMQNASIQSKLRKLYSSNDLSAEAMQWRMFLKNHDIVFLGGYNSRNYKVTNKEPTDPHFGTVKILKVDNRLGMPRHVEHYLRSALGDVFAPTDAARQVRGKNDQQVLVSRTLLVTDLCTSGSVDEQALMTQLKGEVEVLHECGNIMGQMAQVFMKIQEANCCFPDSKISNWLMDKEGKIRLADSKSFVFTQDGLYSPRVPGNVNVGILRTPGFAPLEIDELSFNADKLHASILGRNIYAYLTNGDPDLIYFDQPIFMTKIGARYQKLIEKLIQDPPEQRMSISDAYKELQTLTLASENQLRLKAKLTEYKNLYNAIALTKISKNDSEMDKFLAECNRAAMKDGNDKEQLQNLSTQIEKMRTIHEGLTSPANKEVLNIAQTHEKRERWHNIGMEKKARKIQNALESVPIEERAQLLQSKHPTVTAVLGAIATRRKEMFTKAINEEGKIVVDNSAKVFKAFQEKFKEQMAQRDDVEFGEDLHNPPKH